MSNLWDLLQDLVGLSDHALEQLKADGYVINLRETAVLTGYYVKYEAHLNGEDYLCMKHETEDLEDSVF